MCGADVDPLSDDTQITGSPPRVRSRRHFVAFVVLRVRITSACAEQTVYLMLPPNMVRDHLRVCGADMGCRTLSPLRTGSPPRVRSRLTGSDTIRFDRGITSACAEQTTAPIPSPNLRWDHLRVCGADTVSLLSNLRDGGSPPRVRSRRHGGSDAARRIGITSACAEQTPACCSGKIIQWDHLRVCGADCIGRLLRPRELGSPPRVRSRQLYFTVF